MQNRKHRRDEIETAADLRQYLSAGTSLAGYTVQGVDLTGIGNLKRVDLGGCVFLGCTFEDQAQEALIRKRGGWIFPTLGELPFEPYRKALYTVDELMDGYDAGGYTATRDFSIYAHFHRGRHHPGGPTILQTLSQRLHDHAIDDALGEFLEDHRGRGAVGIMGGHGTPRSDPTFAKVVRLAAALTRAGYLVITGGGPGTMEAGNLGAWLAHAPDGAIDEALSILAEADTFSGGHKEGSEGFEPAVSAYIATARRVVEQAAPAGGPGVSLAVPTWFYGHEPTNLFATAIAKYFDNSVREEGLLAVATAGVIYAPGAAGTMQEIFQDLTQNHYATYGSRSPMVLLGSQRYQAEHRLIQDFITAQGKAEVYGDMIALLDEVEEVLDFIQAHPARSVQKPKPLYEKNK